MPHIEPLKQAAKQQPIKQSRSRRRPGGKIRLATRDPRKRS